MRSLPSERKFIKIIPLIDIEIFPWVSQIFELLVVQDVRGFLSWEQSTAKGKNTQTNKKNKNISNNLLKILSSDAAKLHTV